MSYIKSLIQSVNDYPYVDCLYCGEPRGSAMHLCEGVEEATRRVQAEVKRIADEREAKLRVATSTLHELGIPIENYHSTGVATYMSLDVEKIAEYLSDEENLKRMLQVVRAKALK